VEEYEATWQDMDAREVEVPCRASDSVLLLLCTPHTTHRCWQFKLKRVYCVGAGRTKRRACTGTLVHHKRAVRLR